MTHFIYLINIDPSGTGRSCKVSREPSLLQAEQPLLSQPVFVELLQPLHCLYGLLWVCSSSSLSPLCWGPRRAGHSPAGGSEQRAEPPPCPAALGLWLQPRLGSLGWECHGWLILGCSNPRNPLCFSSGLLLSH